MKKNKKDRELGMGCPISQRDFLNGVAVGVGGALAGESLLAAGVVDAGGDGARGLAPRASGGDGGDGPEKAAGYYPPALTGMRGNHDGSFTYAHGLRDGKKWDAGGPATKVDETYDLVVVGAGISGLAAAYFYRKLAGNGARILILDNHDDFGGHAKRNEFRPGGRLLLANGGTLSIESPFPYSPVAFQLMNELGIDPPALEEKCVDRSVYRGLKSAVFFDKETFGVDRLVVGSPRGRRGNAPSADAWSEFMRGTPLTPEVQADIVRIQTAAVDYM